MLEGVGVEEGSRAGTRLWQTPVWPAPRAALSFPLETPAPLTLSPSPMVDLEAGPVNAGQHSE